MIVTRQRHGSYRQGQRYYAPTGNQYLQVPTHFSDLHPTDGETYVNWLQRVGQMDNPKAQAVFAAFTGAPPAAVAPGPGELPPPPSVTPPTTAPRSGLTGAPPPALPAGVPPGSKFFSQSDDKSMTGWVFPDGKTHFFQNGREVVNTTPAAPVVDANGLRSAGFVQGADAKGNPIWFNPKDGSVVDAKTGKPVVDPLAKPGGVAGGPGVTGAGTGGVPGATGPVVTPVDENPAAKAARLAAEAAAARKAAEDADAAARVAAGAAKSGVQTDAFGRTGSDKALGGYRGSTTQPTVPGAPIAHQSPDAAARNNEGANTENPSGAAAPTAAPPPVPPTDTIPPAGAPAPTTLDPLAPAAPFVQSPDAAARVAAPLADPTFVPPTGGPAPALAATGAAPASPVDLAALGAAPASPADLSALGAAPAAPVDQAALGALPAPPSVQTGLGIAPSANLLAGPAPSGGLKVASAPFPAEPHVDAIINQLPHMSPDQIDRTMQSLADIAAQPQSPDAQDRNADMPPPPTADASSDPLRMGANS